MLGLGFLLLAAACAGDTAGPRELLDKFFSSAVKQDYATTYTCYYKAYQAKVSRDEFIQHRKEASVLQAYKIISIKMNTADTAEAETQLTFGPSARMNRKEPVTVSVKEELVQEGGGWKIKVW
jgi:hypothetical protein